MKHLFPSWIRVPVVFFIIFGIVEYFVDSGEEPAFLDGPSAGSRGYEGMPELEEEDDTPVNALDDLPPPAPAGALEEESYQ